jgi:myo-inositol-1(or 4)-monophosphatase
MSFEKELDVALAAAAEAAKILKLRSGADDIREKGRADLVTAVDEASERAIEAVIRNTFPEDAFIAEEFSASSSGQGRRWVVDPIDGTTNFVHGHPFACVSVGFMDELGPAAAVIHAPFLGEVYTATRGGGAFLNGKAIHVSEVTEFSAALLATGFPFKEGKGDPEVFFRLVAEVLRQTHGVRRAGAAALDLAYVACGRVDGYFEVGLSPWDVAAGALLVTEAGGIVSNWPDGVGSAIDSGRVLASNGRIHPWLEQIAGPYGSLL